MLRALFSRNFLAAALATGASRLALMPPARSMALAMRSWICAVASRRCASVSCEGCVKVCAVCVLMHLL